PNDVFVRRRRNRIESERGKHQPRRHLPEVVVAGESVRRWVILARHDLRQPFLRTPRRAGIHIEIRNVIAGLVSLTVLTDYTAYVDGVGVVERRRSEVQPRIEARDRACVPPKHTEERRLILRHEPAVLPRIAFRVVRSVVDRGWVEWRTELPIGEPRAQP